MSDIQSSQRFCQRDKKNGKENPIETFFPLKLSVSVKPERVQRLGEKNYYRTGFLLFELEIVHNFELSG